jgi:hypothetical protein
MPPMWVRALDPVTLLTVEAHAVVGETHAELRARCIAQVVLAARGARAG